MGAISAAIGRYLKDKERYKAAATEFDEATDALKASESAVITLVKTHGPIEGMGHAFAVDWNGLVVTSVRNCYVIDREIDLSRAAAAYEPATSCYALDGRAAVGRRDDTGDLALVGAAEAMELPDDAA